MNAVSAPAARPILYSLPLSLFNELGRWSLESCGIDYEERRQTVVFHTVVSKLRGGAGTTPLLLTGEQRLCDSIDISEWADAMAGPGAHIYPVDPAERAETRRLVRRFADELGMAARRMAWEFFIHDTDGAIRFWSEGAPRWQLRLAPTMLKLSTPAVKLKMDLSRQALDAAPAQTQAVFDEVAEMLADGRPFLGGERFGIHDIAFAAMASPAVCPPAGYPVPHFQPEDFPEIHAERIRRFRDHPAGQFALRMYAEHRTPATRGSY